MAGRVAGNAALFLDLDETLISVSSERTFVAHLWREGVVGTLPMLKVAAAFLRHTLGLVADYGATKRKVCRALLAGADANECSERFGEFYSADLGDKLRPEVLELVERCRSDGMKIYLVSASLDFVVRRFAERIRADGWFAVDLEIREGRFTGEIAGQVLFGEQKVRVILELASRQGIDLARSVAASDSRLDIPMLSLVGQPVAVAPDAALSRHARKHGWVVVAAKASA